MKGGPQRIRLEHGSGGELSRELVEKVIYPCFAGAHYPELLDSSPVEASGGLFLTTDSYVVDPLFFPGGDIGRLAVFGTCNDLAVCGAEPAALTLGLILEEGLAIPDLERVLDSIRRAGEEARVRVVSGDTKVVPQGKGGGIYINTAGLGRGFLGFPLSPSRIRPGDRILVSGPLGRHGVAVLAARENLPFSSGLESDCALLLPLCRLLGSLGQELRFMRDATRGGAAAVLNELAGAAGSGIEVTEELFPLDPRAAVAADLLGLDFLEIANEGVMIAVAAPEQEEEALRVLRSHPLGAQAAAVGSVTSEHPRQVWLETKVGGRRILDSPRGLLLPRIC